MPIGHGSGHYMTTIEDLPQSGPQADTLGATNRELRAMGKLESRTLGERNSDKKSNSSCSNSSPAAAAHPVITSNQQNTSTSQVDKRAGGTLKRPVGELSSERTIAYTGGKRKRTCENLDTLDQPAKVTRRVGHGDAKRPASHTQEVSNTNHTLPTKRSELHTPSSSERHSLQRSSRHP
jgi:hypothetical protein